MNEDLTKIDNRSGKAFHRMGAPKRGLVWNGGLLFVVVTALMFLLAERGNVEKPVLPEAQAIKGHVGWPRAKFEGNHQVSVPETSTRFVQSQLDAHVEVSTDGSGASAGSPKGNESVDLPSSVSIPDGDLGLLSETEGPISQTIVSPDANWSASVGEDGMLVLSQTKGEAPVAFELGTDVVLELAFSADSRQLAFSQRRDDGDADLMLVSVPPNGEARPVVEWIGSEDRPSFSPEGMRLAFVSGRTGIASVYIVDLNSAGSEPVQITNAGLENVERLPGEPPDGFIPPPDRDSIKWAENKLSWTSDGEVYEIEVQ